MSKIKVSVEIREAPPPPPACKDFGDYGERPKKLKIICGACKGERYISSLLGAFRECFLCSGKGFTRIEIKPFYPPKKRSLADKILFFGVCLLIAVILILFNLPPL